MAQGNPHRRAGLLVPIMLVVLLNTAFQVRTVASIIPGTQPDIDLYLNPEAAVSSETAGPVRTLSQVRDRMLAGTTKVPLCNFTTNPASNFTDCIVNPDYIATQTEFIYRSGSKTAKYIVLAPLRSAACHNHNVSVNGTYNPKAAAACIADKVNSCTLGFTLSSNSTSCYSTFSNAAQASFACPNSEYYWYLYCLSVTNESQCRAAPGGKCVYTPYGPAHNNFIIANVTKAQGVSDAYRKIMQDSGACVSQATYTATYPNGPANATNANVTSYRAWFTKYFNSQDPTVLLSAQGLGNCAFSQNAVARTKMISTCSAFNTVPIPSINSVGIARSDTNTSILQVAKAQAADCIFGIGHSPASATSAAFDFLVSQYDQSKYWATWYDAKMDGGVYKAYTMCKQNERSFDASLCNAVTA